MLLLLLGAVSFVCFALETSASTHWVVTERGRIQAKDDTMFDMKNPDDLVGFLELEKKLHSIENLTRLMSKKSNKINNSKLGNSMHTSECKSAIPIEDCNFYFSTALAANEFNTLLDGDVDDTDDFPDCKPLNFSVHFYEHLLAMQDRSVLSMHPERSLLPSVNVDCLGHQVAAHLKVNQTSWQLYNLATLFWRAKGDAHQAINCVRRALSLAPASNRHISLLHLGNIFHQSRRSAEAAIILHAAIDHSARDAESHWALGNVYSVLGDFKRAIMCFENAYNLDKSLLTVEKNLKAVKCHSTMNQALSEATNKLQELLEDLEDANLLKQEKSHIEGLVSKYKDITHIAERNLGTEVGNRIMQLDDRLKGLVDMVQTLSENLDFEKRVMTRPDPTEGECLSTEDIDISVIYSAFENRVLSSLNEDLGLQKGDNHPLPWHPPVCDEPYPKKFQQVPSHVMTQYLTPSKSNKLKPQPELMKHLHQFVNAELKADEELGQRIHAALKRELGSRGLLRTFAGLYWYARGELRQAANCFLSSLHVSPENDSVIPLTALSSMLMSLGHSDSAVYLALKGVNSKMSDVGGNVLLASLYLLRGEMKNSKLHLQQAFLHRPRGHLRSIAQAVECHIRNSNHDDELCEVEEEVDEEEFDESDLLTESTLNQCIKMTKNK